MRLIRTMPIPDTLAQVIVNAQLTAFEVETLKDLVFNVFLDPEHRQARGETYHLSLFIRYEAWLDEQQSEVNRALLMQGLN